MRRVTAAAALLLVLAAAARAGGEPAAPPQPPPLLFLSPSGEPFRKTAATPDPLQAWFEKADVRHQGYLDREEFRADAARFFHELDVNGDGVVDGFEVADYEKKIAPELAEWAEGRAPGEFAPSRKDRKPDTKPGPAPRAIAQLIYEPEPVSDADYNLDSHITLAEWMRATDQRFDLLDADKSGRLTLAGLRAKLTGPKVIRK